MLDLEIRGGKIFDGSGASARDGDPCIRGERIVSIGNRHGESAARIVDLDGLPFAPGFIDVHSHYDRLVLDKQPDLVVFDPRRVLDTATYENPIQQPEGMPYVLVNGQTSVDDGRVTGVRTGKVLRRAGHL